MNNKFKINTASIKNIKVYKDTWESEGFVCIDNFLDETSAYFLHLFLSNKMSSTWWSRIFRSHEEGNQIKEYFRIIKEDKQKSMESLIACQQAFGKHIFSYAFDEVAPHGEVCPCILCNYRSFLKSNMFKTFMHGVTDKEYQLIRNDSYKPTRYLSGHFLSPHADETQFCEGASMLLSLTKGWFPAYGGNLQITTKDQTKLKQSIAPGYNKLVLINNENEDMIHSVTHVAPFVRKARYTLSARLAVKVEHSGIIK